MSNPPFKIYEDPDGRGTYGLISGCITTLFLCVWTAVHLDVPTPTFKGIPQFWRKGKWVMLGMLAPELLLFTACLQYWSARSIQREAEKLEKQSQSTIRRVWAWLSLHLCRAWSWFESYLCRAWTWIQERLRLPHTWKWTPLDEDEAEKLQFDPDHDFLYRKFSWTSVHSFYACMGGFAFDLGSSTKHDTFLPENQTRVTLTAAGVKFLMKYSPEIVPDISREDIMDKSKADGLAKLLVCLQAIWFCVQFIARVQQNLPFSLLELNTFAHAVCVLVSYYLWWKKPFDVGEPTLISCEVNGTYLNTKARQACAFMYVLSSAIPSDHSSEQADSGDIVTDLFHYVTPPISEFLNQDPKRDPSSKSQDYQLRMELAYQWTQQHPSFEWKAEGSDLPVTRDFGGDYNHALVVIQNKMAMRDLMGLRWRDLATLWQDPYILLRSVCFCFIAAAYGAVHASAWNLSFPTSIERIIWRWSAVLVASLAFSVPIAQVCFRTEFWEARKEKILWRFLVWVLVIPGISTLYSLARLYIVAESLRQVFYLSPEVFREASLAKYLPHFS
ncbi:hypothetical protein VKT23_016339 [Stygiomarasmius scandens]|uniref:Uncharacterized protein n=1 Tax=Marasmiellus scandens TaxID=2682957 RepID=A0ABR1IVA0_9AGAR